jgi:L-histidine N-alpha-methyltransferase
VAIEANRTVVAATTERVRAFAEEVRRELTAAPRQLQSKYLYDSLGSCLFEAICRLPWYRITRAETALLHRHANAIVAAFVDPLTIIELGCGSGEKLLRLAEALQQAERSARVHLIDISTQALELSERALGGFEHVSVIGHRATYEVGLRRAATARDGGPLLVLLLGSNIGNFDPPAAEDFLREIRRALAPGDGLLLGADLVKPEAELRLAYDDPLGVTAAFNKNLLVRVNRELGGDFDLAAWDHAVRWNEEASRIEMHLVSREAQRVRIAEIGLTIEFARGETVWTESSYKYEPRHLVELGGLTGFDCEDQWVEADARFALTAFRAA